jgi:phenylacetate-coenzyme A ligase PaaK-like adenylate-forming protein
LDVLALRAARLDLSNLRQVTTISETLTPAARDRLERAFGATVIDNYSSGECLFLSNGCRNGRGMHLNADWVILENVDQEGRPVLPGTPGAKTYLTNLANTVQPFIRYEVPDRVVMADSDCGCGNRLPRVERVDGRAADFFWIRAEGEYRPLLTYPFHHTLEYFRNIREWQAVQRERNRIVVRLEPLPGTEIDLERVRAHILDRIGFAGPADDLQIELEVVDRLDWDPRTGKLRRMVTLVGPPNDLPAGSAPGAVVRPGTDKQSDSAPALIATGPAA